MPLLREKALEKKKRKTSFVVRALSVVISFSESIRTKGEAFHLFIRVVQYLSIECTIDFDYNNFNCDEEFVGLLISTVTELDM